ncbi:hypothetical protein FIM10_12025 [Sphingomonadales bacterium 56]|uniref:hypothetical protein n=1 Tax=Sphingobium sp. S6 TaxID=2758386 RepID=UPI0019190577|nr:hypothetical protein [Sphingobium sp. S6]MBY2929401.1 hypothetical protein [Sphingomonadales bacterium 56]
MGRLIFLALVLLMGVFLLRLVGKALRKGLQGLVNAAFILANVAGAALVAALAGLLAFVVLPIALVGDWFGIAVSGVAILVFVLCLRKFGRREALADRQLPAMEEEATMSSAVVEEAFEPETDPRVAEAWKIAGDLAPEHAKRLGLARRSCARVLEMAAGEAVEWSIIDCSTFVSRTVPEAVSTAAALMKDAAPSERRCLADELVVDLERIAQRAREEIDSRRLQLRNSWNIVRTHIASRTSRDAL